MPQVIGLEHEYAVTRFHESYRLPIDPVLHTMFGGHGRASRQFLANGARFYRDIGDHPEYATPECGSIFDLIAHEKAGERILEGHALRAEQLLHEAGERGTVYVFKNNTDFSGRTYGTHENYQVRRDRDLPELADLLLPFLVTRQLLVGSGKLTKTRSGVVYAFSQRAGHMYEGLGISTTADRGIISTRDEPHADRENFRRLHVIVGDANMSEVTTLLKVGSTKLILDMIEDGVRLDDLRIVDPADHIRRVNLDLTGRTSIALLDGRRMTAVDLQREYLRRARRYASAKGILYEPAVGPVIELWRRTLNAVDSGDYRPIVHDIDWAAKLSLLQSYQRKHRLPLDDPRLAQIDLGYHDIHRGRGLYYLLERRGSVNRVVSDLRTYEAKSKPPPTRAMVRSEFVKWAQLRNVLVTVDWSRLTVDAIQPGVPAHLEPLPATPRRSVELPDALKTSDPRVGTLMRETPVRSAAAQR